MPGDPRRALPSVDRVVAALDGLPQPLLVDAARAAVDAAREVVATGATVSGDDVIADAQARVNAVRASLLHRVVNATGVIVHTNLGRVPLDPRALDAASDVATGYSNLEYRMEWGERGSRHEHAGQLLARVCGAEAGIVVNNNAAAVLLALGAVARDREVIVSRGELVEIGGGFRVPEIMAESRCRLVEVGTTNRTRRADYEAQLRPETALVLKVHASNYRMVGFTEAASIADVASLGPPVMVDAGSGLVDETTPWLPARPMWLHGEPGIRQALADGAALVTFSGDKLLGGPQAGVILGRADLVAACSQHPLARAVRADKVTLAAMQYVALAYLTGTAAELPLWRMACLPVGELRARAAAVVERVARARAVGTEAVAGGGSLPGLTIPSAGVALEVANAQTALARLREWGVIARIEHDAVVCDLRTVDPADDARLADALAAVQQPVRTVATAGHVDHGKSSLVLALTGTDPDRFPEEKTRGLTIDLGFAFAMLPSGTEVGFVDVPGHVRFIKNMLAGVGAVDIALLVVAATEGWMPQTEEHFRILELLGVEHGMVAITKADLVDDETLELAELEITEHVEGTPLAAMPVVVCDSLSGRGLDDVRATLDAVLGATPAARDVDRPRLWVDRVFAAKGAGTVVTGTLTGGTVRVDDELEVGARGTRVRVRGIETAKRHVDEIGPGNRIALNLVGVEHHDLARGDALVRAGQWSRATTVDVRVQRVPGEKVARRGRVQVYVGSGEHGAGLRMLDPEGEFARLRFTDPLPLAPGDRVVIRDPGRERTVAGAEVLVADVRGRARDAVDSLQLPLGARLVHAQHWVAVADVPRVAGIPAAEVDAFVADAVASGAVERAGNFLVDPGTRARLRSEARARVAQHHREVPTDPGLEVATLASALREDPARLRSALEDTPGLVVERGVVRDETHVTSAAETPEAQALVAALDASPFSPASPAEVGAPIALVRALVRDGVLVDVDNVIFTAKALEAARQRVIDVLAERGSITVADVRDALGSSRKYVVPIVGWLDRTGVTRRRGDDRIPGPTSGLPQG